MSEKRYDNRCKKRLKVRFGEEKPIKLAFTEDISHEGMFIHSALVFNPGTHLQVEVTLKTGETILFEGIVRWAKRIPPTMIHKIKGGMGIEIIKYDHGKELFLSLCRLPCGEVCEQPKTVGA